MPEYDCPGCGGIGMITTEHCSEEVCLDCNGSGKDPARVPAEHHQGCPANWLVGGRLCHCFKIEQDHFWEHY